MGAASAASQSSAMPQPTQGKSGPIGNTVQPNQLFSPTEVPQPISDVNQQQLPPAGQQSPQPQGKGGNQITYPSTSGQQQFGQPMQQSAAPYSNTIGEGQQSNQMQSSGKGKGA